MNWIVWRLTLNRFKEWWWCRDLPKKRRKIGVHKNQANYEDVDWADYKHDEKKVIQCLSKFEPVTIKSNSSRFRFGKFILFSLFFFYSMFNFVSLAVWSIICIYLSKLSRWTTPSTERLHTWLTLTHFFLFHWITRNLARKTTVCCVDKDGDQK